MHKQSNYQDKGGVTLTQRMLVIEDEPTLSRLLSYNLTQEGFQVEVEEHGTAGYEKASNHEYDLILLDVMRLA